MDFFSSLPETFAYNIIHVYFIKGKGGGGGG